MREKDKPLLIAGGLWEGNSPRAGQFFKGKFGELPNGATIRPGTRVFIFKNRKPNKENSPTHFIMVEDTREDNFEEPEPEGFPGPGGPPEDDDIPF